MDYRMKRIASCLLAGAIVISGTGVGTYGAQTGGVSAVIATGQMCIRDRVKVETVVTDEVAPTLIDKIVKEINTGHFGDGKIFVYDVEDAVRIRTGEHGTDAVSYTHLDVYKRQCRHCV